MRRGAILTYGVIAYASFVVSILYLVGFLGNIVVPKSIDESLVPTQDADPVIDLIVNLALITAFALQHSIMARRGFKNRLVRFLPKSVERSTFVLSSSVVLGMLFYFWRPMTGTVWHTEFPIGEYFLWGLFFLGWLIALLSTFAINHFDLFGLRQVIFAWRKKPHLGPAFSKSGLYRYVRHPINLGFLIAVWSTPHMTVGHLVFAAGMTVYIFMATMLEERDLVASHGNVYRTYQDEVPMIVPSPSKILEPSNSD